MECIERKRDDGLILRRGTLGSQRFLDDESFVPGSGYPEGNARPHAKKNPRQGRGLTGDSLV
jgi:hypothetical protein